MSRSTDLTQAPIPDGAIRPLIVDSHPASRLGLGVLLQREPWVARCLLARDGREGARLARHHKPQVALVDVSNAGPFVSSATAAIVEAHPAVQIVLTSRCARALLAPARELGAVTFLPPDASRVEIVTAVRNAVTSRQSVARTARDAGRDGLTGRDRDLLALISTGATNREIAAQLYLSPDGVKKSASALYRKLGVRNRTEAAQRAAELLSAA